MTVAEGVSKARVKKLGETLPLFIGKPCVLTVAAGIFQIDLMVGNIEVAAGNDRFLLRKTCEKVTVSSVPDQSLIEARKLVFRVGCIDVDKPKLRKFQSANTPLIIRNGRIDVANYLQRFFSRKNGGT